RRCTLQRELDAYRPPRRIGPHWAQREARARYRLDPHRRPQNHHLRSLLGCEPVPVRPIHRRAPIQLHHRTALAPALRHRPAPRHRRVRALPLPTPVAVAVADIAGDTQVLAGIIEAKLRRDARAAVQTARVPAHHPRATTHADAVPPASPHYVITNHTRIISA